MANLEKSVSKEEKKIKKFFKKKENIFMSVAVILGIALIIALVWPRGVSSSTAGKNVLSFAEGRGIEASLIKVNNEGSFYQVVLSIQGQEVPVYVTKDGKYMVQSPLELVPSKEGLTGQVVDTPTEVEKSDKPIVEAFVFSYCPYGLQFQKALLPVYNILKDKADIRLVAVGAMHGEFEEKESLRQIAIEELYGKDMLWKYLQKFMGEKKLGEGNCRQEDSCTKPLVEGIMKQIGADPVKVNSYMSASSPKIYDEQNARAAELGISGSPTFVINGVQVQVGRSPEAVKKAVCDAFNTAPSECSQTLSTASVSAWFGYEESASASSAAQC